MRGGEIFIPKIPSMKIIDLADVVAPGAKKKVIGIRPGEKIDEVLITEEEADHTKEFDKFFVIEPQYPFWEQDNFKNGKPLSDEFRYSSGNNKNWMTKEKLKDILEKIKLEEL